MNTIEKLTSKKVKICSQRIGINAADDILNSFSESDGTAKVNFYNISDKIVADAEKNFGCSLENGFDNYLVIIDNDVNIYFSSEISKLYALHAINAHYKNGIGKGMLYGRAVCNFRGYKSYLPGADRIEDFLGTIDMLLSLGYNKLTLELGGAMEYKRHPEINEGWVEYCNIFKEYNGKTREASRMFIYPKTSIHVETGSYGYLTQEQLKIIIDYCRERHMEIIPEVPCLSHADYILYRHPELSEVKDDLLPNNVCPSNEDYYKLLFDLFDEVIDLFKPERINIGHDEVYVLGYCEKCRKKSAADIFADDVIKIHDYLSSKGVATMLWGDKVINTWHGGGEAIHLKFNVDGWKTNINGETRQLGNFKCFSMQEFHEHIKTHPQFTGWYVAETHSSAPRLPKDLQICNWTQTPASDEDYKSLGFYTIYGNASSGTFSRDFLDRLKKYDVDGFSVSNWGDLDYMSMQRGYVMFDLFFGAFAAWSDDFDSKKRIENSLTVAKMLFDYKNNDISEQKHIEITHSCNFVMDHLSFDCGYWVEREDFHIGDYEIDFTDGTSMTYPIIWGENIGTGNALWNEENPVMPFSVKESAGTALVIRNDDGTFSYRIVIPTDKEVKDIHLKSTDKCVGKIEYKW